jgi:DNA-binding LytR/AlgR family response regulator
VERALGQDERYLRCHQSYLVDLRKVQCVSGNAQGLKLHHEGGEEPVPVSHQLTPLVRERLVVHP